MLKIAIDAGHYLKTPGKRCLKKLDANQTREWVLNSRIADKLTELLQSYDCEILRVDDVSGAKSISLSKRCKSANAWNADVYISIHHNAGVNGGNGGGTVVFYYSSKAERETQAKSLYNEIVKKTGLVGNRASKVVKKYYYVLSHTNAPAFLLENGFMDSARDVPVILSEEHADKTAQGLLAFLRNAFNLASKDAQATNISSANFEPYLVRITEQELNVRQGAGIEYNVNTVVRKNEVFTIIAECNGWGKLKSGAGWINLKYTEKV